MEKWIDYERCTGCTACSAICPKGCIKMEVNKEGFFYPVVDEEQCVSCGLCQKVCPLENAKYYERSNSIWGYKNVDEVREKSTSGGFFSLISDYVLCKEGVIYGAAFDEEFKVKHIRAITPKERDDLRYSKYVQSNINDVFKKVLEDLNNDKFVLFTGTPCQISGLNVYLENKKVETSKLVTSDFVCHGVPSPLMWQEYLDFIQKKYNDKIISINFRDKTLGWHKPCLNIQMKNNVQSLTEQKDPFYQLFYSNCILRKSCHSCAYTKVERVSDITIGDCWGIETSRPQVDDNKGISLVIANSDKGKQIIEHMRGEGGFFEISYSDLRQPHLYGPAHISRKREKFWENYNTKNFLYILKKYGNYSIKSKIINAIKRLVIKVIKK